MPFRGAERWLTVARTATVVLLAVMAATDSPWHTSAARTVAWVTVAAGALGTLVLWGWARGSRAGEIAARVDVVGFLLDIVVVTGLVASLAWPLPLVAVTALAVPASAYLRYAGARRRWGHALAAANARADRLVETDRLKDEYIAVTSHEIRGPLSAIISAVDTVRSRWDKIPPDRRDHLLEMVFLQGRELDRLVQDLMLSAEMQGGGLTLQPEWVDLQPVMDRALDAAASKRRAHLLEVFIEPLRVEVDPYRLSQIVRNLVENAYKYTPDRTRVAVGAHAHNNGILLEVADDGDGIPEDKRGQLFEAFSRIEETAAGKEGVGLGLYVVSQLVAAMGGRIDLASSSRGTTFSIYIPCPIDNLGRPQIGLVRDDHPASGEG
ncbi:MAG TPA: HAMP domain-containing sensor histidine kinase [Actinomycetota bacterium]|nr:HAMP domain-containing sensor histidine kinase [Actinomycetota bacterium]